ncbi:MAG: isoprenylcysteine carboxylmethyltransferase family protein [Planctomycetota bacterium]
MFASTIAREHELSSPPMALLVGAGLLLAQRMSEVALSRANVRRARAQYGEPVAADEGPRAAAQARAHELGLYGVHALFFLAPLTEAYLRSRAGHGWPSPLVPVWLGLGLLALAQWIRLRTIATLRTGWRVPTFAFRGAPIVTTGPYARVRHPNHAAVLLEFAVAPLLAGAPVSWLILNLLHTPFVIARTRREERALARVGPYAQLLGARPAFVPRLADLLRAGQPIGASSDHKSCN